MLLPILTMARNESETLIHTSDTETKDRKSHLSTEEFTNIEFEDLGKK